MELAKPDERSGVVVGATASADADADLLTRARRGDHRAFSVLIRRHDPVMRRLAFRLLADVHLMDDVLQEAYVKAFQSLPRYRGDAQFASWLYRITYTACIDQLRQAIRGPVPMADPYAAVVVRPGPE